MRLGSRTILGLAVAMAGILAVPSVGLGQATSQPDTLRTPRNNVKGGSLAANRPGLTVSGSIAKSVTRNQIMLQQFGGATFGPATPTPKQTFVNTFFQSLFQALNDVVQQLTLGLRASQATTTGT